MRNKIVEKILWQKRNISHIKINKDKFAFCNILYILDEFWELTRIFKQIISIKANTDNTSEYNSQNTLE